MKILQYIVWVFILGLLTSCTSGSSTPTATTSIGTEKNSTVVSTGTMTGPESFPAEAKAIIDKMMKARQSGDTATADTLQQELDTKFPNLPKPGAGWPMGGKTGSGGFMAWGGASSLDTSFVTTKFTDVVYGTDSTTQKLDIYLPEGTGPFPVVVAIHGGAFAMGNKTGGDLSSMISAVKKWYAVVAVDYRLSGETIFPAAIDDIQKAIVFVKQNATKYKLNPEKMATWGDSAGGNLAALAGTKGSKADNTNVQAVVDWFGPIYFSTMDSEFAALGVTPAMGATNTATSPETKYLWKTIGSTEAEPLVKQASPQTYITSDDPAFLIEHGNADKNIPLTQSQNFAELLKATIGGEKVTLVTLEGAGHGTSEFHTEENLAKVFAFLDKYLK